jgi:hypothetical protein
MIKIALVVVLVGVLAAFLFHSETPITGKKFILGQVGYDIVPLQAPSATSLKLDVLSYILTRSIFGASIRRILLNDNKVANVREIASQIDLPPMFYPMKRLNKQQIISPEAEEALQDEINNALLNGFDETVNTDGKHRTIQDYANFYAAGNLPSNVMKKTILTAKEWESQGFIMFSSLKEEEILLQAKASDERHKSGKPLSVFDGVPIAFKDMMDIKGTSVFIIHACVRVS